MDGYSTSTIDPTKKRKATTTTNRQQQQQGVLLEYPPRKDARGFALHHWRLFTGYTTAAICGADKYSTPAKIYREWYVDFEEAVRVAEGRDKIHIPAIAAGHYWEEYICCVAARHLYKSVFLTRSLCIREAGPVQDPQDPRSRATADSFLCRADGSLVWPPVVIEAKFSTMHLPQRPNVAHLFQLHHQMRTLRIKSIFIAYGHSVGASKASNFRDGEAFVMRLFHVVFSAVLWAWIEDRRRAFMEAFERREEPSAANGVPNLSGQFEDKWVHGNTQNGETIPDEPTWRLVTESPPYDRAMLAALPKRLPAVPSVPDPVQ